MPHLAVLLAAAFLTGCAATGEPARGEYPPKNPMDKVLARLVWKGELDKAMRMADSLSGSREPAEREIAAYWKALTWLHRNEPDSALAILASGQGKWTGGLRRIHASLFLDLAREVSQTRAAVRARHEETVRTSGDKSTQDKLESLQKETTDLRAENARLETEKVKYQTLLKDLETIR